MKRTLFAIFLTLLFVATVYLPNSFAQDYTQLSLPDGVKARLGKGRLSSNTNSEKSNLVLQHQ